MAFEFREDVVLQIPDIEGQLTEFSEAEVGTKGLIIEVAAIHEGQTSNHNIYSKEELAQAVESWVTPYPKPVILNHDPTSEPVGRVMAAKMDQEADGTAFTRLQLAITDPAAIEKVMSQRYLTGSVGGKAEEANCTICGENWAKSNAFSQPCKHVRGRIYKGVQAAISMKNLSFKEYSWVNMPADQRSSVLASTAKDGAREDEDLDDGWVRPARVFALSMDKEEIFEYTESENRDVLSTMKRKDAAPLYLQLKGAFLSALAVEPEIEEVEEVEDILSVSEGLSQDLAVEPDEEDSTPHVFTDQNADGMCDTCGKPKAVHEDPAPAGDKEAEEGASVSPGGTGQDHGPDYGPGGGVNDLPPRRPQGMEHMHRKDVDAETSQGAPRNRQSEDGDEVSSEAEVDETDLSEQVKALESRVEELTAREKTLSEENERLKVALKRTLVERVVDAKITLALVERSDRESEINEHLTRSASSLADSLRDLSHMTPPAKKAPDYSGVPVIEGQGIAVPAGKDERVITMVPAELTEDLKLNPEDVFVDALMGRRKL